MRSRDVWLEVAAAAGIPILHRGLAMVARRPEARAVLEAFLATEMGEGCALLTGGEVARARFRCWPASAFAAVLHSPHELRVESRDAIPALARWLDEAHGVDVSRARPPSTRSSRRRSRRAAAAIEAEVAIVCPGDDLVDALPRSDRAIRGDALQAAHAAARRAGERLAHERGRHVRSRHGPLRGLCRSARGGGARSSGSSTEQRAQLENGVHLIVVQSADGSLVVGDSHHYAPTPDPFAPETVDELILEEFDAVFGIAAPENPRAVDRHLRLGARPPDVHGPPVGRRAARDDHQRHRREHLLRDRRGDDADLFD